MAHADSDLQSGFDGELSPAQIARISEALEKDPEARLEFERLKSVDAALRGLAKVDPPAGLRQEVMRQVRLKEALKDSPVTAGKGWLMGAWEGLRNARPVFQVGLGFALGILVLLPALLNSPGLSLDPGHVAGTISANHSGLPMVLAIQGSGIKGELLKGGVDGGVQLELRLTSDDPVSVAIVSEAPVTLGSWDSEPSISGALAFAPKGLTFQHNGVATYHFRINQAGQSLPDLFIAIGQDGEILFQEDIP